MLHLLGVAPILGRPFNDGDATQTRGPATVGRVLVDYEFWQSRLGGADDVIGRQILLNARPTEIIGVLPRGFALPTGRGTPEPIDCYQPFALQDNRNFWAYSTLTRLEDGVTFAQANSAVTALAGRLRTAHPKEYSDGRLEFRVSPLLDDMVRQTRPALRAGVAGVLLLLLIAVANATALVVARLKTRARDLAMRSAIGASRGALVFEVLAESAILSVCGALVGALLAAAGVEAARRLVPHSVPRWNEIAMGWRVVADAGGLALVGLFVSGLIPVWKVSRGAPWQALREGAAAGGRVESARPRLLLVGTQVALTVVLAFGAVQLVRSARHLTDVRPGFDPNVLTLRVPFDFTRFQTPADQAGLYQRVRDRLRELPGATAVGAVSHLPLSGAFLTDAYTADLTKEPGWDQALANYYAVTPGYFAALHIPIRQGRDFTDAEDAQGQHLVVVDESLARAAFPGVDNVVGRTLRLGWGIPDSTIIGVVGSIRGIDLTRDVRPQIYAPYGTFPYGPMNLTVAASGDPGQLADAARAAVADVGTGRAVSGVAVLADNVTAATATLRAITDLVALLAISAGLLSTVGLYSVLAFIVHERRRATAIRSALGASPARLVWHHLRTSGGVVLVALVAGGVLTAAAAPALSSLIFDIGTRDALSLALALLAAGVAGTLGSVVPIRRAARVDPVSVLRGD